MATLVGLVVGLSTHTEPTLLNVCWVADEARYVEEIETTSSPAVCRRPEMLKVNPVPMMVYLEKGSESQYDIFQRAVDDLNTQAGFELFRPNRIDHVSAFYNSRIFFDEPAQGKKLGWVSHSKSGEKVVGQIHISSAVASDRELFLVLQHELGHLIGLAHDDYNMSIMFPSELNEWETGAFSTPHLSDTDKRILNELYN